MVTNVVIVVILLVVIARIFLDPSQSVLKAGATNEGAPQRLKPRNQTGHLWHPFGFAQGRL